jgi:hypothetical protein
MSSYNFENISKAFKKLKNHSIVAREDYTCCQNCGCARISKYSDRYDGYCFYHDQDFECAKETGKLWLAYGDFEIDDSGENDNELPKQIGKTIVKVLKSFKLKVEWNGDPSERILVLLDKL